MRLRLAGILLVTAFAASIAFGQTWREQIDRALQKKASYDFNNVALADVFRQIAQDADVNVILDSSADIDPTAKISLKVKDMTLSSALTWAARTTGLETTSLQWCIQDEAVYVTKYSQLTEAARRQIETRIAAQRILATRTWLPAMQEALSKKITVNFTQKELADCRDTLRILLGVNIIIAPDVNPKASITLGVSKMTADNVLSWVVRQAGVDYAVLDEAVYIASADAVRVLRAKGLDLSSQSKMQNLISFDFTDMPLDVALDTLSRKAGVPVVIRGGPAVMPHVTLAGMDMALSAALQAVVSKSGLKGAIMTEGDTVIVAIARPVPAPEVKPAEAPAPPAAQVPSTAPAVKAPAEGASTESALALPVPAASTETDVRKEPSATKSE